MPFWTVANQPEPLRRHRWVIEFTNVRKDEKLYSYYAKKVKKPELTINPVEHKYLGHTFNFPGNTKWTPVDVTLVDVDRMAGSLIERVRQGGYSPPASEDHLVTTSKDKAVGALGDVYIRQIGAGAPGEVESGRAQTINMWILHNAWISKLSFGELDYSSDELVEVTLQLVYDYASFHDSDGKDYFDV